MRLPGDKRGFPAHPQPGQPGQKIDRTPHDREHQDLAREDRRQRCIARRRPGCLPRQHAQARRHQAGDSARRPHHRDGAGPVERQIEAGARYAADQEEDQEQTRAQAARHHRTEGQQPKTVNDQVGPVIVKRHVREERNDAFPDCAGIGHVTFQKGTAVTRRDQRVLVNHVGGTGRRGKRARGMGSGQSPDQPQHDGGRAEDRLARRLGLQESHGPI